MKTIEYPSSLIDVTQASDDPLVFEPVTSSQIDSQLILTWINDPISLKMSYYEKPKTLPNFHGNRLLETLLDPQEIQFFCLIGEEKAALILVSPLDSSLGEHSQCCQISIFIRPSYRGKGFASKILSCIEATLKNKNYISSYAEIMEENTISQKAFIKAGYHFLCKQHINKNHRQHLVLCYIKKLI